MKTNNQKSGKSSITINFKKDSHPYMTINAHEAMEVLGNKNSWRTTKGEIIKPDLEQLLKGASEVTLSAHFGNRYSYYNGITVKTNDGKSFKMQTNINRVSEFINRKIPGLKVVIKNDHNYTGTELFYYGVYNSVTGFYCINGSEWWQRANDKTIIVPIDKGNRGNLIICKAFNKNVKEVEKIMNRNTETLKQLKDRIC